MPNFAIDKSVVSETRLLFYEHNGAVLKLKYRKEGDDIRSLDHGGNSRGGRVSRVAYGGANRQVIRIL